jgi:hypothetical protein
MAKDKDPYSTIKGLTLEPAIECVVGSLTPLYAAAAAYWHTERSYARKSQGTRELPADADRLFETKRDFVREREAISRPFIEALKTGELVADFRRHDDLGAVQRRLRPDEAFQLRIDVEITANSLCLLGPDNEKLHALFWSRGVAPQPDAFPIKITDLPTRTRIQGTRKRKRKPHLVRPASGVNDCTAYIAELLNKSPNRRTITLAELRTECQKRFKLTWRDFDQARQDALAQVPHAKTAWTAPGRR